ncbi:hypothetical protein BDP67DRAFT_604518 [Colletotrichum lupini]|nr:hypothetical protein BDP67DRAFT_604518 [Colletotrichum lupini]
MAVKKDAKAGTVVARFYELLLLVKIFRAESEVEKLAKTELRGAGEGVPQEGLNLDLKQSYGLKSRANRGKFEVSANGGFLSWNSLGMFEAVYEIFDNHLKDRFEGLAFVDRAAHSVLAISALGHGPWSPRWSWPQQARGLPGGLPVLGGGPVADRAPQGLRRRRHHELHCQALEPNYGDDEGYPRGQGSGARSRGGGTNTWKDFSHLRAPFCPAGLRATATQS